MASFIALLRCGRRHDEGKNASGTQANCDANPTVDDGISRQTPHLFRLPEGEKRLRKLRTTLWLSFTYPR
jgi:hypothetical protein